MLVCSGSFFCQVCGRRVPSILVADPGTKKKWRQCINCDTPEGGLQILRGKKQNVEKE